MDCELPTWFNRFLVENGIQKESYCIAADLPRYIRLKDSMALDEVTRDLGSYSLSRVHWLPDFYSIDHDSKIVNCGSFKRGLFYGIDVSSGVAVTALEITKDDQILDLCCAPGAKLCYMADLLGNDGNGTITGVDVSKNRLSIVRSQLKKCKFDRIRLFNADGTKFRACPPKKIGCAMIPRASSDLTDDPIDSSPFHASRLLRGEKCYFNSDYLYDKVIVDAECTHDGSIVHVKNCSWKGWSGLEERLTSKEKLCELEQLQRGLISNGFAMLKPGGILVYSTCSFTRRQNEDIIKWFLQNNPYAYLEQIPGSDKMPVANGFANEYNDVPGINHAKRFSPLESRTSGLFVARVRKQSH